MAERLDFYSELPKFFNSKPLEKGKRFDMYTVLADLQKGQNVTANPEAVQKSSIGEARNVPQTGIEKLLASLGSGADTGRKSLNKVLRHNKSGIGLGNLIFGEGPEMLEDLSWGKSPILPSGHGFRIDPRMMDLVDIAAPGAIFGKKFAKAGIKDLFTKQPLRQAQGGYVLGEHATNANKVTLKDAKNMHRLGYDEDAIYADTKWRKDPHSGKWQFEVEHGNESFPVGEKYNAHVRIKEIEKRMVELEDAKKHGTDEYTNLSNEYGDLEDKLMFVDDPYEDVVKDSVFAREYPDASSKTTIEQSDIGGGSYMDSPVDSGGWMNIGGYPDNLKQRDLVKTHETQHAISAEANFPPGGNPDEMYSKIGAYVRDKKNELIDRMKKNKAAGIPHTAEDSKQIKDIRKDLLRFRKDASYDTPAPKEGRNLSTFAYLNLVDEDLARLVERRSGMTQKQMDADPWYKHLNKDAIYLKRHTKEIVNDSSIQKYLASGAK